VVDAGIIANAHLFGGGLPPPSLDTSAASSLVLVGTIAFPDPSQGLAILGESREQTALFRVGSQVPGGGQIKAVFADRVSIERNGMLTTLKLPRSSLVEMGLAPATLPTGTNKEMIGSVFLFTAVLEDDRFIAAKVYPGQDATAFKALGLRPGDEIKEVNREEYSDPVGVLTSLAYLQPGETVEITVLRKDAFLHLALEGSSVARIRSELLRAERVVSKSKNIPPDKTP
jgi:general secretion pathway protein C